MRGLSQVIKVVQCISQQLMTIITSQIMMMIILVLTRELSIKEGKLTQFTEMTSLAIWKKEINLEC